jgi:hypothetical protein
MSLRPVRSVLLLATLAFAQTPSIVEIQVNQALGKQLNGAADYVAGKDTAIRAFLSIPVTVDPENTRLVIERNGAEVTRLAPALTPPP